MSGVFSGQKLLMLDNDQVSEFNMDKNVGVYDIHVKLYFRIRFRRRDTSSRKFKPKVKCDLKVPLSSINNETFTFHNWILPNKCKVAF
ncbi:NDR1/HIN1 protein [Trifolium repens]|nr:NDR1/HIN1 protein [Trifolium repens]